MKAYKKAEIRFNGLDRREVLVTLQIPNDAKTNLRRTGIINASKAQYRCNKAIVLRVEDVYSGATYPFATSCRDPNVTYTTGKEIEEKQYDENVDNVCAPGIHFFLDKTLALMKDVISIEDGSFEKWYPNGQQAVKCTYKNGKRDGLFYEWYQDGNLGLECSYQLGVLDGSYQEWWENGNKRLDCVYDNGEFIGEYITWSQDGKQVYKYVIKPKTSNLGQQVKHTILNLINKVKLIK